MDKDFEILLEKAKEIAVKRDLTKYAKCGHVGCALMTKSGNIYTGISTELKCNLGKCAEYAAIVEMLKNNETEVSKIVAYSYKGMIYPPCGTCRENIRMVNEKNLEADVMVAEDRIVKLKDLLPEMYQSKKRESC